MEILNKNIAPSVFISPGEFALIQVIKATGGAPLLNIMRIYTTGPEWPLYKHGLKGTPLYGKWLNIKERLFTKTNHGYPNYGGRGITMYKPWIHNAKLFYDYVTALPHYGEKGLTLDRIDNNGNYEPGNLRWANRHIQCVNQNMRKSNKTGFVGVYYTNGKKYPCAAQIRLNRKIIWSGYYNTSKEAAIARNNYIIENNLTEYKLNDIK